ncbi:hypothetical protein [Nocardia sp. NPDC050175]|uniref:hypothetical protein n=1 Tax=Nocardia sp. NPDC050175 TaxID=3364317 RepID=UPI00379497C6
MIGDLRTTLASRPHHGVRRDFSFMGFLDAAENARMLGARDSKWIIYRASDFDLAVPYVEGAGLFLLESRGFAGNLDDRNGNFDWVELCAY